MDIKNEEDTANGATAASAPIGAEGTTATENIPTNGDTTGLIDLYAAAAAATGSGNNAPGAEAGDAVTTSGESQESTTATATTGESEDADRAK